MMKIKELGYGGYVALEDHHNTYAIFNPKNDVIINKYYFDGLEFDSWDFWEKFKIKMEEVYSSKEKVDKWDIYKKMKNNL